MKHVLCLHTPFNASMIYVSESPSILDVASSNINILGFFNMALASMILCFYPPDNDVVPSDLSLVK